MCLEFLLIDYVPPPPPQSGNSRVDISSYTDDCWAGQGWQPRDALLTDTWPVSFPHLFSLLSPLVLKEFPSGRRFHIMQEGIAQKYVPIRKYIEVFFLLPISECSDARDGPKGI
jgi:hypothetical protein